MNFFHSTQLTIPLFQMTLVLVLSTLALLFGRPMLALFTNYVFFMHWGYISNRAIIFGSDLAKMDCFHSLYFGFGAAVVFLVMVGFIMHGNWPRG